MDDAQVLAGMVLMNVVGRELVRKDGAHAHKFRLTAEQAMCCGASEPKEDVPISGYKWMVMVKRQALEFLSQDRPVTKKARREAREILEQMCDGYDDTDDEAVDNLDHEAASLSAVSQLVDGFDL